MNGPGLANLPRQGVYSGVVSGGNGDADPSNLNSTSFRGIQKTDEDGAVQFQAAFPG